MAPPKPNICILLKHYHNQRRPSATAASGGLGCQVLSRMSDRGMGGPGHLLPRNSKQIWLFFDRTRDIISSNIMYHIVSLDLTSSHPLQVTLCLLFLCQSPEIVKWNLCTQVTWKIKRSIISPSLTQLAKTAARSQINHTTFPVWFVSCLCKILSIFCFAYMFWIIKVTLNAMENLALEEFNVTPWKAS